MLIAKNTSILCFRNKHVDEITNQFVSKRKLGANDPGIDIQNCHRCTKQEMNEILMR